MNARPYTAVLVNKNNTRVINISAPLERDEAHKYVQEKNPGELVIALIPGQHANYSYAFGVNDAKKEQNLYIDLFDTSHLLGK